jgi:Domain of unknown function (DUF4258)
MLLKRLSRQEAIDLVRHCLEDGEVRYGSHFRKALLDEGLTIPDARAVLRSGAIYDEPEEDIRSGEWKYRVEGYEPGGKWLVVVLTFKEVEQTFLITVFSIESRKRQPR